MPESPEWVLEHLDVEKTSYTAEEFYEWYKAGKLILSPDFQRGEVWKNPAKSFLIDTILRSFPIPPVHLRHRNDPEKGLVREVIDGQQRLTAVIQYLEGRFALTRFQTIRTVEPPWARKRFRQLDKELQERVQQYSFRCEVYKGQIDDMLIREIFSRINMYSVPLNDQEIRNGKYFGQFKQAVYELTREHESFWIEASIFNKTGVARMLDAQLVSECLVAEMAGQQDKKAALDSFYHRHEDDWDEREKYSTRFRETIDAIRDSCGETLKDTYFRRPPHFYTLFCVVYHRLYGLEQRMPKGEVPLPRSPVRPLDEAAADRLAEAVAFLTDVLGADETDADPEYADFRRAASRQTDNIRPRLARFRVLWDEAALSA